MDIVESVLSIRDRFLIRLKQATVFDNFFMRVVFRKKEVCQYVLRKILKKPDLVVIECRTEVQISKLFGKDSRLDVLATDSTGKMFNIEIQRETEDVPELRVRIYHSAVDSEMFRKGKVVTYKDVPTVYVVYISKEDIWGEGAAVYTVGKSLEFHNKTKKYDDKQYTVYVNAEVKDKSDQDISALMEYFKLCDPNDSSQGVLSEYVRYLKIDEKGNDEMYDEFEKEFQGDIQKKSKADDIAQLMINVNFSFEKALKALGIPEDDYDDYTALLNYFYPDVMKV